MILEKTYISLSHFANTVNMKGLNPKHTKKTPAPARRVKLGSHSFDTRRAKSSLCKTMTGDSTFSPSNQALSLNSDLHITVSPSLAVL